MHFTIIAIQGDSDPTAQDIWRRGGGTPWPLAGTHGISGPCSGGPADGRLCAAGRRDEAAFLLRGAER